MGNSNSQAVQLAQVHSSSFHGTPSKDTKFRKAQIKYVSPENRVLPPPVAGQRLRSTDNGSILQNGGTISGRKVVLLSQQQTGDPEFLEILQKRSAHVEQNGYGHRKAHSDPDIVHSMLVSELEEDFRHNVRSIIAVSPSKAKIKSRKKAKAPEPPQSSTLPRDLDRMPTEHETNFLQKIKYGLKHRDTNKSPAQHGYQRNTKLREVESDGESKHVMLERKTVGRKSCGDLTSQDSKAFQEELIAAAKRRSQKQQNQSKRQTDSPEKADSPKKVQPKQYYFAEEKLAQRKRTSETPPPIQSLPPPPPLPIKKNEPVQQERWRYDMERTQPCLSSVGTSDDEEEGNDDEDDSIGIELRPTLPRKSFEVPRFSPTEAWRSLSNEFYASLHHIDLSSDEAEIVEEHINRQNRPIAPRRIATDRCADSGISPDAGSPDLPRGGPQQRSAGVGRPASPLANWTPQQDLPDDSDGGGGSSAEEQDWDVPAMKLPVQCTVFGRKLPNNETAFTQLDGVGEQPVSKMWKKRVKNTGGGATQHFNSLRSLKKVLGLRVKPPDESRGIDSNWSLSRSTPTTPSYPENTTENMTRSPSESTLINEVHRETNGGVLRSRSSDGIFERFEEYRGGKKSHKFSYQSTVRKEEKRHIAEKLASEVVTKERRREQEIQWMNRVEEEFRKRRDREKISIRYQLQMLNNEEQDVTLNKKEPSSLPFFPENRPPSSEATNDSPDLQPQKTGMSKWLTRRPNKNTPRPEPEGGRSSGEEDRIISKETAVHRRPTIYDHLNEVAKNEETMQSRNFQNYVPKTNQTTEQRENRRSKKPNESLVCNINIKQAPGQEANFSRNHPHRNGGHRIKATAGNGAIASNQNGNKSPLHLPPVQPFTPNKSYRPVPFNLVVQSSQRHTTPRLELSFNWHGYRYHQEMRSASLPIFAMEHRLSQTSASAYVRMF